MYMSGLTFVPSFDSLPCVPFRRFYSPPHVPYRFTFVFLLAFSFPFGIASLPVAGLCVLPPLRVGVTVHCAPVGVGGPYAVTGSAVVFTRA
jgi:hypothetical protein